MRGDEATTSEDMVLTTRHHSTCAGDVGSVSCRLKPPFLAHLANHSPLSAGIRPLANHTGGVARSLSSRGKVQEAVCARARCVCVCGVSAGSDQGQGWEGPPCCLQISRASIQDPSQNEGNLTGGEWRGPGPGPTAAGEPRVRGEGLQAPPHPVLSGWWRVQHLLQTTSIPVSMLC